MGEEVRNAAERLRKLLRAAQYPQLSALRLEDGDVSDLLRVLHFVLLDSSRVVAQFLADRGYDLYGKTDARFVESAFRLLRDEFRCFPSLSAPQFLSKQFVARRLAIVADAAAAVALKRQELQRQKRAQEAVWSQPQQGSSRARRELKPTVENHVLPSAVANHAASILQHLKLQQPEGGQARRPARRASSDTPTQVDEAARGLEAVVPPPPPTFAVQKDEDSAPHVGVRFASDKGRSLNGENDPGNVEVQADGRQVKTCSCQQDNEKFAKAVGELTRQISEMSSALMAKMSSVETRLGRLESQMHDIQATIEGHSALAESNSTRASRAAYEPSADVADKRRDLDIEPPCAWPPQPSVFERY
ncbi:endoplasmic reticulum-golgi intermediate compartment [Phytophthora cinnamomi]|uniref:endoplasmic reticulum-golgi intermediate compartment n=1 Tax=Phytophthora cinnamomi TaxID=4785 RepID=UPI00355A2AF2|nr:endoplasmic reticulum-golgi intermediate compartment [Phytophthora cinnamomi]